MAVVLGKIVERINNDKKLNPSPAFWQTVGAVQQKVKLERWKEAYIFLTELVKKEEFSKKEIKYLKMINKRLKKVAAARAFWPVNDGEMPPFLAKPPAMNTLVGNGTGIYGNTLYLLIFFIPVLPLGRYAVVREGLSKYSFHGKLEITVFQKIWRWAAVAALFCAVIYICVRFYARG